MKPIPLDPYLRSEALYRESVRPWFVIDGQDGIVVADFDTEEGCLLWIEQQPNSGIYFQEENGRGKQEIITHLLTWDKALPGLDYLDPETGSVVRLLRKTERFVTSSTLQGEAVQLFYWRVLKPIKSR